jgi:peptidoglycan L-alanyl-D-glutamate endopeptidase CwlK
MPSFGTESKKQLETCAPELQRLFNEVVKHWDCKVIEGKRSEQQHAINLASGASRTTNSKHVTGNLPSQAADVAPFPIKWANIKRFYAFAGFVIGTAKQLGIPIRWGGDWDSDRDLDDQTFNDLVHFELVS